MKKIKTLIHDYRKSRPHAWLMAQKRRKNRPCPLTGLSIGDSVDFMHCIVAGLVVVLLALSACSSHHYFSINAEEISNPSIMYSDSTSLTNPF